MVIKKIILNPSTSWRSQQIPRPTATDKRDLHKWLHSPAKCTEGQPDKAENLLTITILLWPNTLENTLLCPVLLMLTESWARILKTYTKLQKGNPTTPTGGTKKAKDPARVFIPEVSRRIFGGFLALLPRLVSQLVGSSDPPTSAPSAAGEHMPLCPASNRGFASPSPPLHTGSRDHVGSTDFEP